MLAGYEIWDLAPGHWDVRVKHQVQRPDGPFPKIVKRHERISIQRQQQLRGAAALADEKVVGLGSLRRI